MVVYGTAGMQLQYVSGCCKSTIKVRRKYAVSKAHVRLKYGKSTVKYGKSIVLYGNIFWRLLCMYQLLYGNEDLYVVA